jgi:hypothetical protein
MTGGMPFAPRGAGTLGSGPKVPEPISTELLAYNNRLRPVYGDNVINLSGSSAVNPLNNILYRPDRAYRTLGQGGYDDFLNTGLLRAKPNTRQAYADTYFSKGVTDPRFMRRGGDKYIAESLLDETWKTLPGSKEYPYMKPAESLSKTSPLRVFEKQQDGAYKIVFDNLKDQGLIR